MYDVRHKARMHETQRTYVSNPNTHTLSVCGAGQGRTPGCQTEAVGTVGAARRCHAMPLDCVSRWLMA
jgi:hypothetical protein